MPNNPREKKAFDFVPGSVNVPIPLTPSQGKREWEEEEGALVYRYVKGIRWEKGTLTLSLSQAGRSMEGVRAARSQFKFPPRSLPHCFPARSLDGK